MVLYSRPHTPIHRHYDLKPERSRHTWLYQVIILRLKPFQTIRKQASPGLVFSL